MTAQWFRDGKSVLICGNEPGKGTRFYVQEIGERRCSASDVRKAHATDGSLRMAGSFWREDPKESTSCTRLRVERRGPCSRSPRRTLVAQWSVDGQSVLAYRRAEIPCRLERVDLATGHRTLFKELAPADRAGLLSTREIFVTDDLRSYAYTAYYQVSSLFVSEAKH